jgi:hypothetical protein
LSEKYDFMGDAREISSLSLSLPAVTHAEGTVDAGVYISPVLRSGFPCGTNRIASEFNNDLFRLVVPTITCLYLSPSHDLSLIVILNCPAVSSLKFFKGKQLRKDMWKGELYAIWGSCTSTQLGLNLFFMQWLVYYRCGRGW